MSLKLFEEDELFLQCFLKGSRFYTAALDGVWGEKTDEVVGAFEETAYSALLDFGPSLGYMKT